MRDASRLADVLASANPSAPDMGDGVAGLCWIASSYLRSKEVPARAIWMNAFEQSSHHPSPHIRELLSEALHYWADWS
jgi:hypothetical protein